MISLTSPVETRAHHWPAGAKLTALAGATGFLFTVHDLALQALFLAGVIVLYLLPGRVFFHAGLSRLKGLWPFVLLLLGWHIFTGDPAFGLLIVCRMLSAVALATLVTMTTKLSDMIALVRWALTPLARLGVKTDRVALAMALVIRFTPVLTLKAQTLGHAWRARSARRPGWRVLIPFAVLAIDDAEQVAEALRARGGV